MPRVPVRGEVNPCMASAHPELHLGGDRLTYLYLTLRVPARDLPSVRERLTSTDLPSDGKVTSRSARFGPAKKKNS